MSGSPSTDNAKQGDGQGEAIQQMLDELERGGGYMRMKWSG